MKHIFVFLGLIVLVWQVFEVFIENLQLVVDLPEEFQSYY